MWRTEEVCTVDFSRAFGGSTGLEDTNALRRRCNDAIYVRPVGHSQKGVLVLSICGALESGFKLIGDLPFGYDNVITHVLLIAFNNYCRIVSRSIGSHNAWNIQDRAPT